MHSKQIQEQGQRTIFLTLQKFQESTISKIALVALLTSIGVLGRVAFQSVPSVEPLTPLVILTGFFFGPIAGAISGASGFYASNFLVWGGQGPWTILQCIGAGLAGFIGGIFGFGKKGRIKFLVATVAGVIAYEIIVTVGSAVMFPLGIATVILYILTSLPFSAVHLLSSLGFSMFTFEFKGKINKLRRRDLVEEEILGIRSPSGSDGQHSSIEPFIYLRRKSRKSEGQPDR